MCQLLGPHATSAVVGLGSSVPACPTVNTAGAASPCCGLGKAQKIRMRLGGSPETEEFPDKPKGMHWRTYDRLCRVHDAAEERSTIGLMHFALGRRTSGRA